MSTSCCRCVDSSRMRFSASTQRNSSRTLSSDSVPKTLGIHTCVRSLFGTTLPGTVNVTPCLRAGVLAQVRTSSGGRLRADGRTNRVGSPIP